MEETFCTWRRFVSGDVLWGNLLWGDVLWGDVSCGDVSWGDVLYVNRKFTAVSYWSAPAVLTNRKRLSFEVLGPENFLLKYIILILTW